MRTEAIESDAATEKSHVSTLEAARMLSLAVRSIQMMVDRGDLLAWKTPGGHRRIAIDSIERWSQGERNLAGLERRRVPLTRPSVGAPLHAGSAQSAKGFGVSPSAGASSNQVGNAVAGQRLGSGYQPKVLLIEDSVHFQNMVKLLLGRQFPDLALEVANDGIAGLVMTGQFQPDVLLVDILLPGVDGATLITSLRSMPQFKDLELIVVTSLEGEQLAPYRFALYGVPVVHKPRLVEDLPLLLAQSLERCVNPVRQAA